MQNNTTKIVAIVIAILAIGGIATLAMSGNKPAEKMVNNTMSKTSDVMKTTDDKMAMDKMKAEETMMKKGVGKYTEYSANKLAQNPMGTNVIFFHASWCPTCKAAETDINAKLTAIPANFNILKVDYDTSTDLKQKYGVTSQSTFINVDKDGNKLSMGNGFTTLADIVAFGNKDKMTNSTAVDVMQKADAVTKTQDVTPTDKMTKEADTVSPDAMNKSAEIASPTGMYAQYSVNNLAQNPTGTNVIFFHAPWCPTCKAAETDINANLDKIPADFQILKTDFDTSTALKQKYGVTSQSTFVKVDKDGNKISMGNGFTKLADIVAFGQK
jgi:thiol-disulfide isomerase/thioredoxin